MRGTGRLRLRRAVSLLRGGCFTLGDLDPPTLRRLVVFSSGAFARDRPAWAAFFFELNRLLLFDAGADFAFVRAGVFLFVADFRLAFAGLFFDIDFARWARPFDFFVFFFFVPALWVIFFAMVV